MKKLLISAFVVSMFAGSHAFAGENIPLAAALGTGAVVTVTAAGGMSIRGKESSVLSISSNLGTALATTGVVVAAIVVASEAGGTSTTNH